MAAENDLNKPKQTATYIGESGNKQTGVYAQPAQNAGLAAPQAAQGGSHWDTMRGQYQTAYDEQVRGNESAYDAAAARAREVMQQNVDALNKGYQGTNKQLYRDYMEHQRTLPQEMAARGYSGGLSESAQLRLRNSYEEGLNENERARLGQISSAEGDLAQKLYEARAAADAANRQANQQRLSSLTGLEDQRYAEEYQAAQLADQRRYQEQQLEDQRQYQAAQLADERAYQKQLQDEAQARQDLENQAATLASAGDFSGYASLGYTEDQISYLQSIWARQNPALAYSMGKISAGTYYQLTGAYPPGYSTGSSSPSYSGSGPKGDPDPEEPTTETPSGKPTTTYRPYISPSGLPVNYHIRMTK